MANTIAPLNATEKDLLKFLRGRARPSRRGSVTTNDVRDFLTLRGINLTKSQFASLVNRVLNDRYFIRWSVVPSQRRPNSQYVILWR